MPDARLRRLLPLFVLGFLFIGTCTHHHTIIPSNNCASSGLGQERRELPVMCVDNTGETLSVHPDSVRVWDAKASGGTNMLHWTTRSKPANLQLRFRDTSCVETPDCDGKGNCHAKAVTVTNPSDVRECKYDVIVDGRELDPEVVLVKCCSG